MSHPVVMANQSRRRKYRFYCFPTFVSLISCGNLSQGHLTLVSSESFCFTKAKEMVNRGSREKLGTQEPYRRKLAIIKTLKTAQSDGLRGPVRAE